MISWAMALWQPIASIVTSDPWRFKSLSSLGIAVISLLLAAVLIWPKTRRLAEANAEILGEADLPAACSKLRRSVLPSTAISRPWEALTRLLTQRRKQRSKAAGLRGAKD